MKIVVFDTETTHFLEKGGELVEFGAVSLDLSNGKIEPIYEAVIRPEHATRASLAESWICSNGYMTKEEIMNGRRMDEVKSEIEKALKGHSHIVSYNTSFDFGFMDKYHINIPKRLPCPMIFMTPIMQLPPRFQGADYKWPSVEESHEYLFGDVNYKEKHRALDDAKHEAQIIYEMYLRYGYLNDLRKPQGRQLYFQWLHKAMNRGRFDLAFRIMREYGVACAFNGHRIDVEEFDMIEIFEQVKDFDGNIRSIYQYEVGEDKGLFALEGSAKVSVGSSKILKS